MSRPARGEWIEMEIDYGVDVQPGVSPREGRVD